MNRLPEPIARVMEAHSMSAAGYARTRIATKDTKAGFIYVIAAGSSKVKIGWAKDPKERCRKLQTGTHQHLILWRQIEGTIPEERALHRRFKQHSVRGEWFHLRGDLEEWVHSLPMAP